MNAGYEDHVIRYFGVQEENENMASVVFKSLAFTALLAAVCLGHESSSVTEECKKKCERTYPLHTYPKSEPKKACLRGCRLAAISQLSTQKNRSRGNATHVCMKGCAESYPDNDSKFACHVGCKAEPLIPTAETMYKKQLSLGIWSLRGYTDAHPVMIAQQYCHGVLRKVTYYMASSTSYFFGNSQGEALVIRIKERPQVFASISEVKMAPREDVGIKLDKRESAHHGYTWKALHRGQMWLNCVSHRSGLPFWLVTSTLFLAVFFMLWLCCATITTSSPTKDKEKRLLVDDLMLLTTDDLEKKPLIISDEAGPLPVKVNISATTI